MVFTAEILGFTGYIPPYAAASGEAILKGLNYASAAAGILEETGWQLVINNPPVSPSFPIICRPLIVSFVDVYLKGGRVCLSQQVEHYKNTVSQMVNLLGDENAAATYLSKCLYTVVMGSNDYLNNYFMPRLYSSSHRYSLEQFSDLLIQRYSRQLKVRFSKSLYMFLQNQLLIITK